VRPQDAEAQAGGSGSAHRRRPRGVGIDLRLPVEGDTGQARLQVGVGDLVQLLTDGANGADRGEALFGLIAVQVQVLLHQGLQQGVRVGAEGAVLLQDLSQGFALVEHPGVHGADEGIAADEVHLQGQDAQQQVAIRRGTGCRHGAASSRGWQDCQSNAMAAR
jgi:hypothetical protein